VSKDIRIFYIALNKGPLLSNYLSYSRTKLYSK